MLQSKEQNVEHDQAYRTLVEARNDAEPVLRSTEKRLSDAKRLLSADEFRKVETALKVLQSTVAESDPQAIKLATFKLDQATRKLADLIVADAITKNANAKKS